MQNQRLDVPAQTTAPPTPAVRVVHILLVALVLLPLLVHAYSGVFMRFIADDFCTTHVALTRGVFGSVAYWYTGWGGQYTNWFVKGIAGQIGLPFTLLLPGALLVAWFAALMWTLLQFARRFGLRQPVFGAALLAAVFLYAAVEMAPSVIQSFYWLGAVIPYTLPLVALTFTIGFIFRAATIRRLSPARLITAFLLPLIAGGLGEVYAVLQTAALGLLFIACAGTLRAERRRSAFLLTGVGIIGSIVSIALILAAPGNAVRAASFPDRSVWFALPLAANIAVRLAIFSIVAAAPAVLCALAFPAWIAYRFHPQSAPFNISRRRNLQLMALTLFVGFGLTVCTIFPGAYAFSYLPPPRHLSVAQFPLICTFIVWGYLIGLGLKPHAAVARSGHFRRGDVVWATLLGILIVIGPVASSARTWARVPELAAYAQAWDTRDTAIRQAIAQGESSVTVAPLTPDLALMADLQADFTDRLETCAARYYEIPVSIAG